MVPHTAHGYNSPTATISREIVCSLQCIFLQFSHNAWHFLCIVQCLFKLSKVCYYKQVWKWQRFRVCHSFHFLQFGVTLNIFSCNAHACKIGTERKGTLVVRVKASASGLLSRHTASFLRRRLAAILLGRQRVTEQS